MANHKQSRVGVEAARQAYLYGIGNNGVPLRDRVELQRLASVQNSAFSVHLRNWERESERMALEKQENNLGLSIKPENVENHANDVHFLRLQVDQIKSEVENIDDIQADLWSLVQNLQESSLASSEQIDALIQLIDRYLKKSINRQNLLTLFLSLQRRWQDSSGMTGALDVSIAGMKEVEKAKRLQSLRDNHSPEKVAEKTGPRHVEDTAIFRR